MYDISIPFKTTDIYNGFAEGEGMLHANDKEVVLEYLVKDAVFGVIKSDPKKLRIPYRELGEVRFKGSFWGSRFKLHVSNFQLLSQYPASKNGIIKLKIKRAFKRKAIEMETYINTRIYKRPLKQPGTNPILEQQAEDYDPFLG